MNVNLWDGLQSGRSSSSNNYQSHNSNNHHSNNNNNNIHHNNANNPNPNNNNATPPNDPNGDLVGGTKMMCYNVEYTFPLLKEQGVTGLVFIDAGNVFSEDQSWTFSGIRKSAGGGIRWYSPIGPLRLEYGVNLDPQGNESSGKFEFSVGGLM